MRKFFTSIASCMLVLGLSLPTLAQTQSDDTKSRGDASSAKEKAPLPATKQMDKASSPEKTGVPESGATSPNAAPATKAMDKAASPDKSGASDKY